MIGMPARAIVLEIGIGVEVICENRSAAIPIVLPQRNIEPVSDLCDTDLDVLSDAFLNTILPPALEEGLL